MMSKKMCGLHKVSWVLLEIGGINWLLVGLLQKDLFELLGLGMGSIAARAVYVLVGIAALMMLSIHKCCMKCECGQGSCPECGPKKDGGAMMPPKA